MLLGLGTPGLSSGQAPEGTCRGGRVGQLGPWVEVQPQAALLLGPDHPETLLFPHLHNGAGDLPRLTGGMRKVTLTDCSMQDVCARGSRISCVAAKAPRAFWPRLSWSAPAAPPPRQAFPLLALDSYIPFLFLPTCPVARVDCYSHPPRGLALCWAPVQTGEAHREFPTQCYGHCWEAQQPGLRGGGVTAAFPEKVSSELSSGGLKATFRSWVPRREGPSHPTPFRPHTVLSSGFWKARASTG